MIELPIERPSVLNCRPSLLSQRLFLLLLIQYIRSSSNKLLVHWFFRDISTIQVLASTCLLHDVCSSVHNIHQIVFKVSSLEEACWVHKNCKVTGWDSSGSICFGVLCHDLCFVRVINKLHSRSRKSFGSCLALHLIFFSTAVPFEKSSSSSEWVKET